MKEGLDYKETAGWKLAEHLERLKEFERRNRPRRGGSRGERSVPLAPYPTQLGIRCKTQRVLTRRQETNISAGTLRTTGGKRHGIGRMERWESEDDAAGESMVPTQQQG